jgi:hypothetical protein
MKFESYMDAMSRDDEFSDPTKISLQELAKRGQ